MTTKDWKRDETSKELYLDNVYDKITPNSYIVIQKSEESETEITTIDSIITTIDSIDIVPLTRYGISAKTTKVCLSEAWSSKPITMNDVRNTIVFAQSERLELSEEPITTDIQKDQLELDGVYNGLLPGRWIIVSGERTDIPGTRGIHASELVMIASVEQPVPSLPGDTVHTVIHLAASPDGSQQGLAYTYKRETVTVSANVVKATNGETRTEVLGSGDASKVYQEFALRQSPLTYLATSTRNGVKSTLEVRVNDILWHETDNLDGLEANDRYYITKTDNSGKSSVVFGDGQSGARIPTGVENVKSVYRTGIGKQGNVKAGQISLLVTRPLGLKGVNNPLRASGGADKETRNQARRNVPLVTMSLDRLVSVPDYADFARTFAGIGKASSTMITDNLRQVVQLTIAGLDDIPIDKTSELFQNFVQALHQYGGPYQPIQVDVREKLLIAISAQVRILPDYKWEFIEPQIRASLLDTFGFDRRELGQNVYLSEIISVIQHVTGVDYVDIELFQLYSDNEIQNILNKDSSSRKKKLPTYFSVKLARTKENSSGILPAQIAYLTSDVPDTLILKELKT